MKMKIYLDTSNLEEIKKAAESKLIDGVTTNPTLISKESAEFIPQIREIIKILKSNCDIYTISVEVTDTDSTESMVAQARKYAKINPHIIIKIPLTFDGLKAVKILSDEEIRCNVTLCFSANQALLAAKAGAWCVSPFIGRIDDEGWDGAELVKEIRQIYDNYKYETLILAASIRSPEHVHQCAKIGADIVTMPYKIFEKLYYNPLTENGLEKFAKDWKEYQERLK